jgi:hypothetical protein
VSAQERVGRLEVTPYAAFRFGGAFDERDGRRELTLDENAAYGLIFNIRAAEPGGQWEASYARQATELRTAGFEPEPQLAIDVDELHFGGVYRFDGAATRPFVAATAGVSHFSPRVPGFAAETFFSAALGGGVQLRADSRLGVRLEGRVLATFLDHDGGMFCHLGGETSACVVAVEATALIQWEARAGVVFRF